jgi:hypothetical protein
VALDVLQNLIQKQDNFEIVRDQIAALLVVEVDNQMTLATHDNTPVVNVWYDSSNYPEDVGGTVHRQKTTSTYNIDIYARGIATQTAEGHTPGDLAATIAAQRALMLTRNILMCANNTYLQLRGTVAKRWPTTVQAFQPEIDAEHTTQVRAHRITLSVEHNEFSPQYDGAPLEEIGVTIFRAETGQILAQADYIYTETLPENVTPPTIAGDTDVGSVITATPGTWTGGGITLSYQWLRDGVPIALATDTTYTLVSADEGTTLSVEETATNGAGSDDVESAGLSIPSGEITRNFTELSSAGSQRFTTPPVTLASDWGIEIDFQDSGGAFATILGSQLSNGDLQITQVSWGAVGGRSNIAVYLSGANEYWPVSSHTTAGVLHTLKVTLTGSTVELFIDGLSLGTKIMTPFTDPVSFLIGANSSLSWLSNGYLANFKITDSGTLVRSYAIDEDWSGGSTVLVDSIGGQNGTAVNITDADAEEFTLNEATDPDQWENVGATIIIPVAAS